MFILYVLYCNQMSDQSRLKKRKVPTPLHPSALDGILRQTDAPLPSLKRGSSYVYQLLDPLNGDPKYIGLALNPRKRLADHRSAARRGESHLVYHWWCAVVKRSCGHHPVMRVIEGPIEDDIFTRPAECAELAWENAHRRVGIELVNAIRCGGGRNIRGGFWTPTLARETVLALVAKLGLGSRYPTQVQFIDNDLNGLRDAIARRLGGHRALALELGLEMRREWDDESAKETIQKLVKELGLGQRYPSPGQMREKGLSGLVAYIKRLPGGHREFSEQMGLLMTHRWNEARAEQEVRELVRALKLGARFPTENQFREAGLVGLYTYIYKFCGGPRTLAEKMGLQMRREWSRQKAVEAVMALVSELFLEAQYPTVDQFHEYGLSGLYNYIRDRMEGHREFAESLSLRRKGGYWQETDAQKAVLELASSLGTKGRYPTKSEFPGAKLTGLRNTIPNRFGGHESFARRIGLTPPQKRGSPCEK